MCSPLEAPPLAAALAAALAVALAGCQTCSDPTPWPARIDQPLGAECEATAQCAAGLDCLDRTCTVPCPDGACAEGGCFDRRYCLPTCASDADCLLGVGMGTCNVWGAPPYCIPRGCQSDAECVSGSTAGRCAGVSVAHGLTWNDLCSTGTCVLP